jgi:hypothetical protein
MNFNLSFLKYFLSCAERGGSFPDWWIHNHGLCSNYLEWLIENAHYPKTMHGLSTQLYFIPPPWYLFFLTEKEYFSAGTNRYQGHQLRQRIKWAKAEIYKLEKQAEQHGKT